MNVIPGFTRDAHTLDMKTNKSFTKRIKVTRNGKIKARKPGFNHFNSKQSRTKQLAGRVPVDFPMTNKAIRRFLPNS